MPAVSKTFKLPNGEEIELYYIGALANALGRSTNAIRKWEISGVIPNTCFRDKDGRRMYSREQIEAIVRCAEKAKIKQGLSIANTSFSTWVHKEMEALRDKYTKK